ncbi:hypothetical protein QIT38_gp12 [Methanocaldococcus fervens tailed virus 1]|uniref:Uncharacterized protein n=2 Tax=root TaxID=1 RepID=C7P5H4_METFA|nr:hypothetical protein [Methanocaldococcus fervens]YP_010772307.1 hypothetical protein QIT38_gp12 [Methanocaldococcus fervens tailed virus 1]ACV25352.1 hypothetical protein Mefer_1549 [Methanocaldococcus fervens AG86]QNO11482.1 hypothetical protein [Methanocaldococcus fervens tailed virus 1]
MAEVVSLPIAATELEPYTFVKITDTGLVVGNSTGIDGVVLPRAAPLVKGAIADVIVLGVATVKLADGENPKVGDYVLADTSGCAVVDNENGRFKVIRVHGQYVDVLIK